MPSSPDDALGLEALEQLEALVRRGAGRDTWQRGVQLAQGPGVALQSADADELEFHVPRERGILAWSVSLFPEDAEWCCDCPSQRDVCEHVCASLVKGLDLARGTVPAGPALGHVHYAFTREGRTLVLRRQLHRDGARHNLQAPLATLALRSGALDGVAVSPRDLDVELFLEHAVGGRLSRERIPGLFKLLASSRFVSFGPGDARVQPTHVEPRLVVQSNAQGYLLKLEGPQGVDEFFDNGAVRIGEQLRPLGDGGLSRHETRLYGRGRFFPISAAPLLMTEVLPEFDGRLEIAWVDASKPVIEEVPPRIVVALTEDMGAMVVEATIVYGDPIQARVIGGELEVLGQVVPLRDPAEEAVLGRRLLEALGLRPGAEARLRGARALAFASKLDGFQGEVQGLIPERYWLAPPLVPTLHVAADGFELEFRAGEGRVSASAVFASWSDGESLVALDEGGYAPLPADWMATCGRLAADLMDAKTATGKLPRASLLDLERLCEQMGEDPPADARKLRQAVDTFAGMPEVTLPEDLRAELRDYQRDGVRWLAFLKSQGLGALLADDMGLGKTLQALCVVEAKTLVVAPTSVLRNWESEARKFRPGLSVSLYHGAKRRLDSQADVVLTTYAILRIDQDLLADTAWNVVVLDEAQFIKNPASKVAQAAFRLQAEFKLALSGTPVENRLQELWSQFNFLNPGYLGSKVAFQERVEKPMARGDEGAAKLIQARLKPFMLRRLKGDVAKELPPRTESVLFTTLGDEERTLYDGIRTLARRELREVLAQGGGVLKALEALLRLRQAACHPALVPGQRALTSSKLNLLGETLERIGAEGHRALVFSQWTSFLDLIGDHLEERNIDFSRLDGSTRDRAGVVAGFQAESGPPVLLLSLKAGGTGLNLTRADHVFIMDPWWNPASEQQAADRAHRIGQERPVMVYRLIAADTVEEKIMALQAAKKGLADRVLAGSSHGGKLTREDLMTLLDD